MIDFTGMIEIGVDTLPEAPGSPSMLFVDEAQDMARRSLARTGVKICIHHQRISDVSNKRPMSLSHDTEAKSVRRLCSQYLDGVESLRC